MNTPLPYGPVDSDHPSNSHVLPALIGHFQEAAQANALRVTCWVSDTPKKQLNVNRLAALGWRAGIPIAEGLVSTVAQLAGSGSERL